MTVRRKVAGAVASVAAAAGLLLTQSTPASAGVWGTLVNNTGYYFTAAKFGQGSSSCYTWNEYGTYLLDYATFTCAKTSVKPHTTTGTLYDVDGFTINRSYNVRWGGGSYMYVGPNVYTRIHDYNKATCNQNSSGAVYCTIS
jgi:hypothetical protein